MLHKGPGLHGPFQSSMRIGVARTVHAPPSGTLPINRSLDLLTFFLADVQTGFGPFIAIYLTANRWTPTQIGIALSTGTLVAIIAQVPAGALIDFLPRKRFGAIAALIAVGLSALLIARFPHVEQVLTAQALHGFASCLLVPAIASITLSRVGRAALAERLGRNARFAAFGSAAGAALMGAAGTYWSAESVFWLAAAFCIPAVFVLFTLPPHVPPDIMEDVRANSPPRKPIHHTAWEETKTVLSDRRLLLFACCIVLFHLANAAMLPLAAGALTVHNPRYAILVVAACMIVPQGIVALVSPGIGRMAQRFGRRPVLLVGFAMLPLARDPAGVRDHAGAGDRHTGAGRHRRRRVRHHAAADRVRRDGRDQPAEPVDRRVRPGGQHRRHPVDDVRRLPRDPVRQRRGVRGARGGGADGGAAGGVRDARDAAAQGRGGRRPRPAGDRSSEGGARAGGGLTPHTVIGSPQGGASNPTSARRNAWMPMRSSPPRHNVQPSRAIRSSAGSTYPPDCRTFSYMAARWAQ